MCGVPTYTVTAMNTHAEYPPHGTSQRLLRVWGHATGRPPCGVSYQNTREGSRQGRQARRAMAPHPLRRSILHAAQGQHTARAGITKIWCDRIASIRIGRSVAAVPSVLSPPCGRGRHPLGASRVPLPPCHVGPGHHDPRRFTCVWSKPAIVE